MSDNDSFLSIPSDFGGRVRIHPNGTTTVFVDGRANSANGYDDDPRVCFIRYRGKDYTHSANWTRDDDGTWTPLSGGEVTKRGSFGMDKAPKTYAAAILAMLGEALERWYQDNDGAQAMRESEVRHAQMAVNDAERDMADAQAALDAAAHKLRDAQARLHAAQDAEFDGRVKA